MQLISKCEVMRELRSWQNHCRENGNSDASSVIGAIIDSFDKMPVANQWHPASEKPQTPHVVEDKDDFECYVWHESDVLLAKVDDVKVTVRYISDDPCMGAVWIDELTGDTLKGVTEWMELPE